MFYNCLYEYLRGTDFKKTKFNNDAIFREVIINNVGIFNECTFWLNVDIELAKYSELQLLWTQLKDGQLDESKILEVWVKAFGMQERSW